MEETMIRTILGFLGYSKIPIEAVQLSMVNEQAWNTMKKYYPESETVERLYEGAKTLTGFLRSGRRLQ